MIMKLMIMTMMIEPILQKELDIKVEFHSGSKKCAIPAKVFTFWLKGHLSRASLWPLITTKNRDKWLPRPVPSPFR